MIVAQSKRSYVNFDYNPYFVTLVKKNKVKKKAVDEEEDHEELKSSFVKALASYKTRSINLNLDSKGLLNKFLGMNKGNLETPRYYSKPAAGYDTPCGGIFIITKGSCEIVNRKDNYKSGFLFSGDYFGESEVFKLPDLTYFGDIYATNQQDVEVIFLNYETVKRVFFSQKEMQSVYEELKSRFHSYYYTLAARYKVDQKLIRMF